jgi:hypothetical protein
MSKPAFASLRLINLALILFGLIDLAGAIWAGPTLHFSKTPCPDAW